MTMFDAWKKRRAAQKDAQLKADAIRRNKYLQKLDRSARCLCGLSFSTGEDTLSIGEVQSILYQAHARNLRDSIKRSTLHEALEEAHRGLLWYRDRYPDDWNGCDDEAMVKIETALAGGD
jgi:hypothetical protein